MGYGGSDDRRKPQSVNDVGERGWGRKILDFASPLPWEGEVRPSTRTSVDCKKHALATRHN